MPAFRVTKYDPALRLPSGAYSVDEWTSVSDVGRVRAGHRVEWAEYLAVEDAYVESVRRLLRTWGVSTVRLSSLERRVPASRRILGAIDVARRARALREGALLSGEALDWAVRLALREAAWFRLAGDAGAYVHFGYDFYMYAGADVGPETAPDLPAGMFAEPMPSPYGAEADAGSTDVPPRIAT